MTFTQRLRRLFYCFLAGFVVLFLLRLTYGYMAVPESRRETVRYGGSGGDFFASGVSKKNYASEKYTVQSGGSPGQVDQKYEKTATVQSLTKQFSEDEKKARETVAAHAGIVQFENGRGTAGSRMLQLFIGVQPAKFDAFYAELQKIGTVRSMEISKTDKTNEFLALKARRASLEKTRAALVDLKSHEGKIDELMALQQQILKIENDLQNLGVQLGDFDEVNAFCTVKFSLAEYKEAAVPVIGLLHRVKVALYWTAWVYGGLAGLLCLTMLAAFATLLAADRLGLIRAAVAQMQKAGDSGGGRPPHSDA